MNIRDRIIEFRRIPASELHDHAGNWRRHPLAQRQALAGVLKEIGIAGALIVYRSEQQGGALTLIDGHLRKDVAGVEWPCLVLDLDDAEADKLLTTYDPIGAMAEADGEKLKALLAEVRTEDPGLDSLLETLKLHLMEDPEMTGVAGERGAQLAPGEFREYDEDIATDYQCPKCGFAWSGKPN